MKGNEDETSEKTRWCVICGKTKPATIEFFPRTGESKKVTLAHHCRDCSPQPAQFKRSRRGKK